MGTVTQVSADTSTVLLANDASSVVGVQMAGGGEIGDVTGTGKSLSGSGLLRLSLFDANAVLRPGQEVVTYASVGDQPEVPGVPVGTIVSVSSSAGSLTQTAMVRPYVNFTALGVVGVVVQVPRHNPRVLGPAAPRADGHHHHHPQPVQHPVSGQLHDHPGRLRLRVCHRRGLMCAGLSPSWWSPSRSSSS